MLRTVGTATLPYSGRIRARDHNSRGVWFAPGSSNSPRPTPSAGLLFMPMLMRSPAEHIQLPAPLEGALDLVHEWLVNIARGENPELDLRSLRAVLLNLRELAEPDSNITEAVDEVFEAALAYQGEFAHAAEAGGGRTPRVRYNAA